MSESNPTIDQIKKDLSENKMVVYMKGAPEAPQCGFSAAVIQILKTFPYPFKGINILANPDIRATLPAYSNWPTFPQIFVNGELIGGCDVLHELRDSGELEQILKSAFSK